jgi:ComF family protein
MRQAIHALKYDRLHPAASGLGHLLADAIAQLAGEAPAEMLVIPIPLHRSKYAQRGFNQARSIAAEALRHLRKSHPNWQLSLAASTLMRLRPTESQAGLTPRQRRLNLRRAFSVSDPSQIKLRHVLLVDDILTTGATARSAAQTLVEAGAASVWVATLARARRISGFGGESVYDSRLEDQDRAGSGPADGLHAATLASASLGTSTLQDQPSF